MARPTTRAGIKHKNSQQDALAVWLDDAAFGPLSRIGTLSRTGLDSVHFSYEDSWLNNSVAFQLDPSLSLSAGEFYSTDSNFGIFLDSCPDRWGQVLMKRRELIEAKNQGRTRRELHAWDFLLGVQDVTRMGALRFCRVDETQNPAFLANEALSAPPVAQLGELQQVALELSRKKFDDLALLEQWLKALVAPGSSLGGARPKANIADATRDLWIAKFPAADDDVDVALFEKLVHNLARQCEINVPISRLERIGHGYHTFLVKRLDRVAGKRKFFTSAMTLLDSGDQREASYLDLAEFIATNGCPEHITEDLSQLFRRVIFNVIVANRDDHLRNHGFIREPAGWRPSPAFDMNPSTKRDVHVLAIDDSDTSPSLGTVLGTAEFYRLRPAEARSVIGHIVKAVANWEQEARALGLSAEEREEFGNLLLLEMP